MVERDFGRISAGDEVVRPHARGARPNQMVSWLSVIGELEAAALPGERERQTTGLHLRLAKQLARGEELDQLKCHPELVEQTSMVLAVEHRRQLLVGTSTEVKCLQAPPPLDEITIGATAWAQAPFDQIDQRCGVANIGLACQVLEMCRRQFATHAIFEPYQLALFLRRDWRIAEQPPGACASERGGIVAEDGDDELVFGGDKGALADVCGEAQRRLVRPLAPGALQCRA